MNPVAESSTDVTASQFALLPNCTWLGQGTVVFEYRIRFIVCWFPGPLAAAHATCRKPAESMAIEGSVESRARRTGLSDDRPEAMVIWVPHVEPLTSVLRIRMTRSQYVVETRAA